MSGRVPAVSAIVVNHRRRHLLASCLESLEAALGRVEEPTEIVVVDNASDDGSRELVRDRHPSAALVPLGTNVGFPRAVNEALGQARGEWLLLINNDATIEPDAVRHLLAVGRGAPDVGSVAAQMRFTGRPGTINSAGIEVDRLGVVYDRLLGCPTSSSEREPTEVFGASAGAALFRRAMLADVGGFDGSFFAFLEDADVAWRARMRGWRSMYAPAAVVYHHHSATAGHASGFKHFHVGLNRVRLLAKNADARHLARYGAAIVAYDLAYVTYASVADRTLAPLRGRLVGLRQWRPYRRAGVHRRQVPLAPVRGGRAALERRRAWRSEPAA